MRGATIEPGERYRSAYDDLDRAEIARRFGRYAAYREEAESDVAFWLRLVGLALIASTFVLLLAYTAAQLSSAASAQRLLARALPEITDFDHTFTAHYADFQAAAGAPANATGVALPTWAVTARIPPNDVLGKSQAQVRGELLQSAANLVYTRGVTAITSGSGAHLRFAGATPLSAQWTFAESLHLLNPGFHNKAVQLQKAALIVTVMIAIVLFALSQGYNRVVMYGVALLVATLPVLAIAAFAWVIFALLYGSSGDPLVAATADLTRSMAWFVILSYVVYTATALALILAGLLLERLSDVLAARGDPASRRDFAG